MKGFKEKKMLTGGNTWRNSILITKNKLSVMENENKVEHIYKTFESSFLYIEQIHPYSSILMYYQNYSLF